ncbi:MAG: C4-type zinc ribbon domain-containing protein [Spirochaetaceae bacterium]|nr:C4-type zinc ribbon domain-containing protein [Spirochaetaceae bacterium]
MQETFDKLRKLQTVLFEKYTIEKRLVELPKQLNLKKELLSRVGKMRDEKAESAQVIEKKLTALRIELSTLQDEKVKFEQQMASIKTQREFELLEKEINDAGLKEEELRKESHKLQLELNEIQKNLEADEQLITETETQQQEDTRRINEESGQEQLRLAELSKEEQVIVPSLSSDLLYKFETIVRNKAGIGIVAVKSGVCQGCYMMLPAQFLNSVRVADQIYFCPYCSRVIYFEEGGENFAHVSFDEDDMAGLADLIDEEYVEEEEPPILIDDDMAGDYEDN